MDDQSEDPQEEEKTILKKTKKKQKANTEIKTKKKKKIKKEESFSNQEEINQIPIQKKKKKKKKLEPLNEEETKEIISDIEAKNESFSIQDEEKEEKPKKKKKKKKKKAKISDIDENEEDEYNDRPKTSKPKKSSKIKDLISKKKENNYMSDTEENNDSFNKDNDYENRPKTSKPKKSKKNNSAIKKKKKNKSINNDINLDNNDNEKNEENDGNSILEDDFEEKMLAKNKKVEEKIIKSNKKNKKDNSEVIDNGNIGIKKPKKKKIINNKNSMKLTKSAILSLFSTKYLTKVNTDYEEEEKTKNDYNIKNNSSHNIEDENENINNSGSFEDLYTRIQELEYKGYNYKISEKDYFRRRPNEDPVSTIFNSEDAAIKKCEELMEFLGDLKQWIDPDFGPQENDNGKGNRKSIFGDRGSSESTGINSKDIEWYSIKEINEDATFFYDGTESNDVMQGALGDCWFISALSIIATKDYLLRGEFNKNILNDGKLDEEEIKMMSEGIYPPIFHSFSTKGIYCFRFFKNFKWRYVLVDDRLPCHAVYNINQPKKLIFAHCRQDNEFWVPLIEKAYAKIHGSYYDIESGCIDDGLVDMTGLVSKKILKDDNLLSMPTKIEELWQLLKNYSSLKFDADLRIQSGKKVTSKYYTRNKSMMGCSVIPNGRNKESEVSMQGHKIGIIAGHAYSILDVFEIPKPRSTKPRKTSRLLRIRNPWGKYEWNGKWCDNSEEVIKNKERIENELKKKYADTNEKIDFTKDDGAFLMRFSDFRKIFNQIFLCQNFPPNFIGVRFYDEWTKENSGGLPLHNTEQEFIDFFTNPQYYFEIKKSGKVIICLLQNDGRLNGVKFPFEQYIKKVCLIIFKTKKEMPIDSFEGRIDQTVIAQRKDLSIELNLEKGSYIAIPSLKDKGECAPFYLEFYFEDQLISNTQNNKFSFAQLKNQTYITKLGEPAKCELINEYISSEMKMASKNKLDFIISAFQYSIKNFENNNQQKNKGFAFNQTNEDEDLEIF